MHDALFALLKPLVLEIENESSAHNVPDGSETHFKILAVSDVFLCLNRIKRHQLIYERLSDELQNGLHALSLHLYTPDEWQKRTNIIPDSPVCHGGSKKQGEQ
jgi:BolA protein